MQKRRPYEVAASYSERFEQFLAVEGHCHSITYVPPDRIVLTCRAPTPKVQCYNLLTREVVWTVEDLVDPFAATLVEMPEKVVWVTDPPQQRILILDALSGEQRGELRQRWGSADHEWWQPWGITTWELPPRPEPEPGPDPGPDAQPEDPEDPEDPARTCEVVVADSQCNRLVAIDPVSGDAVRSIGDGYLDRPEVVQAMGPGRLASLCQRGGFVFARSGEMLSRFNWHIMHGTAMAFDSACNEGVLIVADKYTDRVCFVSADGTSRVRTVEASGLGEGTDAGKGLAVVGGQSVELLLADGKNQRIVSFKSALTRIV